MKRLIILLLCCVSISMMAQAKSPEYVGSDKCKTCHNKADIGAQYDIWLKGSHVSSLETLKTDAAKAIAKKRGLKVDAVSAPECLVCHVTGWANETGYSLDVDPSNTREEKTNSDLGRIGCESCHGPGSLYKSKKNMIGIADGSIDGSGLGMLKITEKTCTVCHNPKSPTYKPFDFAVRVKEVSHPVPQQ